MANEPSDKSLSLLQSVTRMVDSAVNDGAGYDTLINVLTLICLVSVLNRGGQSPAAQAAPAGNANPVSRLLGDLAKGDGGLGPDTLMSLLPLINSPQIKSKLNPSTIGAVLSLLNSMGDKSEAKQEKSDKNDKSDKSERSEEPPEARPQLSPAAAATPVATPEIDEAAGQSGEGDKKNLGRYLNWKSNF